MVTRLVSLVAATLLPYHYHMVVEAPPLYCPLSPTQQSQHCTMEQVVVIAVWYGDMKGTVISMQLLCYAHTGVTTGVSVPLYLSLTPYVAENQSGKNNTQ